MRRSTRRGLTAATVTKAVLPVLYTGTSLRVLAALRDRGDPAVRDMAAALASAAVALSTLPPGVLTACVDLFGDANYARFLSQLGTVLAAGSGNSVLQRSAYDEAQSALRVRRRRRCMLTTATAMTLVFARDRSLAGERSNPPGSCSVP